jgi:hypothetical protein
MRRCLARLAVKMDASPPFSLTIPPPFQVGS